MQTVEHFKAYRTFQEDGVIRSRFVEMAANELDPGDVLVRTKYSTINYKDALSYNGAGKIMRKYPTVGGIDMAGTVETSADPRFRHGDKVIVHAYDMGVAHDGGYAEYVRAPADWIVRRPSDMTAFEAMTLGTAGYTAALKKAVPPVPGGEAPLHRRCPAPSPESPRRYGRDVPPMQ